MKTWFSRVCLRSFLFDRGVLYFFQVFSFDFTELGLIETEKCLKSKQQGKTSVYHKIFLKI